MEGWPVAQRHDRLAGSPELEPLARGLQAWGWRLTGPSYEGLMNGFWHSAGDVCAFVCMHAHNTRAFRETFWLAVVSGRMRQISFKSSYTQKFGSLGSHRSTDKCRKICANTYHTTVHIIIREVPLSPYPRWKTLFTTDTVNNHVPLNPECSYTLTWIHIVWLQFRAWRQTSYLIYRKYIPQIYLELESIFHSCTNAKVEANFTANKMKTQR